MKRWSSIMALALLAIICTLALVPRSQSQDVRIIRHRTAQASGSAPAAPTNVLDTQSTSGCSINSGSFTGCTTGKQYLTWTASAGATSYTILRNGSSLATGVSCCSYTDSTATNTNVGNTFGTETAYAYQVEAVNDSGASSGAYAATYFYRGGVAQQNAGKSTPCAQNFSNGTSSFTANLTSGSTSIDVTSGTVVQYQAIYSGTGFTAQTSYITSASGGAGTYTVSLAPTATNSAVSIVSGINNCIDTTHPQAGATYDMALAIPTGNAQMQLFASTPLAPQYDLNLGGFGHVTMDFYVTDSNEAIYLAIHSRPGANANGTGDIFAHSQVRFFSGTTAGPEATCPGIALNTWFTCTVPLSSLGIGPGTFTGSVASHWHGTGTLSGGTITVSATTDGDTSNIASGDVIVEGSPNFGSVCHATSSASGSPATFTVSGCSGGSGIEFYDDQLTVTSTCSGTPVDNAGFVQDQAATMPAGVFVAKDNAPGAGTEQPDTCSLAATTWGLATGSGDTIPAVSSTTFNYQRFSAYKPAIVPATTAADGVIFVDNFGWTH